MGKRGKKQTAQFLQQEFFSGVHKLFPVSRR